MDASLLVALAVLVAVPVVFGLVVAIIVVAGRARPRPDLGPAPTGAGGAATGGVWNAQILAAGAVGAMGGTLGSVAGTFHVGDGRLSFARDGEGVAAWSVPCQQVSARAHSAFSTAGVELWTPDAHVRCNVSREHINVVTRNSLKSLREARYYREFVDVLVAQGARRV